MEYDVALYLIEIAVVAAMLAASEIAFRIGLRLRPRNDEVLTAQIGVVQATTFGLLGLLLAFAVSMAETRFSQRRDLIRDEANAISTTYLRSKYLLEPHATELAPLFRSYVDARVAFYEGRDAVTVMQDLSESDRIQREIWTHAIAVVRDDSIHGDTNASFVESLNLMFDLEESRLAALFTHVPFTVIVLLVLVALLAVATTSYSCGLAGRRAWLSVMMLPLLVALGICTVLDLDSPRFGLISTGQMPMLRLRQSLASPSEIARPGDLRELRRGE